MDEMANIYTPSTPAMPEPFLVFPDLARLLAVCPWFCTTHVSLDDSHGGKGR